MIFFPTLIANLIIMLSLSYSFSKYYIIVDIFMTPYADCQISFQDEITDTQLSQN